MIATVPARDPEERVAELIASANAELERRRFAEGQAAITQTLVQGLVAQLMLVHVALNEFADGEIAGAEAIALIREAVGRGMDQLDASPCGPLLVAACRALDWFGERPTGDTPHDERVRQVMDGLSVAIDGMAHASERGHGP